MKRLRLRVSHRDASLVVAQGAARRSYKPFAQTFGKSSEAKAALIVKAVNCHGVLVKALEASLRAARSRGDATVKLNLVGRYAAAAIKQSNEADL